MVTGVIAFAAFFSFGYCVSDWFANRRAMKRIDEMLKETIECYPDD